MKNTTPKVPYKITEIELRYKNKVKAQNRICVNGSKKAYEILLQSWDKNKIDVVEQFMILLLDSNDRCLGVSHIGTGGFSQVYADAKVMFVTALKARASSIIMAHNHPSGNTDPSPQDFGYTMAMKQAGRLLEIDVTDHLIISSEGYYSFMDNEPSPSP